MGDSDNEENVYGHQCPPKAAKDCFKDDKEEEEKDSYMPALPPHMRKAEGGATTPAQDSQDSQQECSNNESEEESEEYCPALPPHMLQAGSRRSVSPKPPQRRPLVGPMLPKGFVPPIEDPPKERSTKEKGEEKEEEEGEAGALAVGPLPSTDKVDPGEYRAQEVEERARRMRDKLEGRVTGSSKPFERESWMTELPEDKPNFCGLGPRQFLRKTPAERGDRSGWTDTPADSARKAKEEKEWHQEEEEESTPEEEASRRRDEELKEKVDAYNKTKRAKPLVDLHRKELKRKQSTEGPKERRPFSREEDLSVNKFDEAQRATVLKKARQLNDRFSSGKAKFL